MTWRQRGAMLAVGIGVVSLLTWQLAIPAQRPNTNRSRFEFQVVESFDAKYLGDTKGYTGRGGGLGEARPNVALYDPVYRDNTKVGTVTGLTWDRSKGALQVEFKPEPLGEIRIGETVWLSLEDPSPPRGR
jgi:hypothetical protein